jgi:hypothetical protein
MNTYMTAKMRRSYQKKPNKDVKKVLQDGTYFDGGRITNQELQTSSKRLQHGKNKQLFMEALWMPSGTISWTTQWCGLDW